MLWSPLASCPGVSPLAFKNWCWEGPGSPRDVWIFWVFRQHREPGPRPGLEGCLSGRGHPCGQLGCALLSLLPCSCASQVAERFRGPGEELVCRVCWEGHCRYPGNCVGRREGEVERAVEATWIPPGNVSMFTCNLHLSNELDIMLGSTPRHVRICHLPVFSRDNCFWLFASICAILLLPTYTL